MGKAGEPHRVSLSKVSPAGPGNESQRTDLVVRFGWGGESLGTIRGGMGCPGEMGGVNSGIGRAGRRKKEGGTMGASRRSSLGGCHPGRCCS